MIPVLKNCYEIIDLNKKGMDEKETKYYMLFRDQYFWLNSHFIQIKKKSLKLYQMYINDKLPLNIKKRCCNYKLLEEKCVLYNRILQ